jgi:guanyl-specific ribonuclease Sa
MRSFKPLIVLVVVLAAILWKHYTGVPVPAAVPATTAASALPAAPGTGALPPEARDTLALIARGGPFPHAQDGAVFGNYEGLLPKQSRGYYHEYTVETPGARNRGARRIITGGTPPVVWYYSDDHYRSFRRLEMAQ